jgi:hypothetical protein
MHPIEGTKLVTTNLYWIPIQYWLSIQYYTDSVVFTQLRESPNRQNR